MTTMIGFYFVCMVFVLVPGVLLFAGRDTTLKRAEQKERQREVLLDWTDKAAICGEAENGRALAKTKFTSHIPVEIIQAAREPADSRAA